jgi:hypothetical protein
MTKPLFVDRHWIWNYFQAWKTSKQEFNRCWWSIEDGCPCQQNADVDLQNLIESRTDLESSENDSFIDEILSNNKQNSELKIEKQPVRKQKKKKMFVIRNSDLFLKGKYGRSGEIVPFTDVGPEWVRKMAMSHLSISCWMSICGLIINLESKCSEFFLSVIVLELKYPRLRSFHQIYFPLVNKNRLLKRWVDTVRNWQLSRKKCFYRYHTKGFQATKFRNLL